jgi:hypothetical protein
MRFSAPSGVPDVAVSHGAQFGVHVLSDPDAQRGAGSVFVGLSVLGTAARLATLEPEPLIDQGGDLRRRT